MPSPGNGVTLTEAAHILAVARSTVQQIVLRGELDSAGARKHRLLDRDNSNGSPRNWRYRVGGNLPDDSYWLTSRQVMAELEVSRPRVKQLIDRGFLPAVKADCGVWIFRRHQVEVISNARRSRHG
jgi:predicted site-specific integrase-resolvase